MNNDRKIPVIIKETSSGFVTSRIQDEMFRKREIECIGEITEEMVNSLIMQLWYLKKEKPGEKITMYVNSPGGEVSSGLALYDVMKAVKCPIRTVCLGMAASMAAVLFLSGDQREMLPHAKVMIHDPRLQQISGSALAVDRVSKNLMKTREIIGNIIAEHTGRTLKEVYEYTASDTYFDAEESLAWGLADKILTEI